MRISKDQYYMNIAKEVAGRSTCFRARHGAVVVLNDQIVATGYVGSPRKTKDCFERGNCLRTELNIPSGQRYELCRSVHAEQNALINAARAGVSLLGGVIYLYSERLIDNNFKIVEALPCFICKKMIINAGITDLVSLQVDGSLKKYSIEDWINDWQEKDIIDDKDQYGK
ncbi:MAG: dCMP deaminase family protein [Patescibacteria group bacterium]|nr:dCMP deaminase family protein [Patescibacteria group bacterium]